MSCLYTDVQHNRWNTRPINGKVREYGIVDQTTQTPGRERGIYESVSSVFPFNPVSIFPKSVEIVTSRSWTRSVFDRGGASVFDVQVGYREMRVIIQVQVYRMGCLHDIFLPDLVRNCQFA
jgi:hypothetical protein